MSAILAATAEPVGVAAHPARLVQRATSEELLGIAREQRAFDPSIFEEHPPTFWAAEISSNRVDAYFTRMSQSTLRNFAAEASAGVAFQDSHRTDGLVRTLGHSLLGTYVEPGGETEPPHVAADFYTLTGMEPEIDAFVRKMRGGLVRDVSVGFYGGAYICNICQRDMLTDWSCWHIPGVEYDLRDAETGEKTGVRLLAVATIEDAHLAEVSAVFDGATPGAAILKAYREAEAGRMKPEQVRLIEGRYRTRLPVAARAVAVPPPASAHAEEDAMTGRGTTTQPPADEAQARERERQEAREHGMDVVRTAVVGALGEIGVTVAEGADLAGTIRAHGDELRALRAQAELGRRHKAEKIEEALTEGVRALGDKFDREARKKTLEGLTLDEVIERRDTWAEMAAARFPGGRRSVDADERTGAGAGEAEAPSAAYRS